MYKRSLILFKKKNRKEMQKAQTKKLYAGNRVKKKDGKKVEKVKQERSGKKKDSDRTHTNTETYVEKL